MHEVRPRPQLASADPPGVDGERESACSNPSEARGLLIAAVIFAALLLTIFGDLLFGPGSGSQMPSHPMGDGARFFAALRGFGFGELANGNLPLWDPHSFSGAPFVATFQSAMFYPPNLVYLVLPLGHALTLEYLINLLLLAVFTFAWLRRLELHALAAFFGACTVVFGATCFLHVHGGQLTFIDTIAWLPLLLLAVDALASRVTLGGCLVGVGATSMMIVAGHPPTFYMAGFVTALYCVPLIVRARPRFPFLVALACIAIAPLGLTAVQLLPGLAVAADGIRAGGVSFEFATDFSFPPENLLTLVVPEAFGNAHRFDRSYYGRWSHWGASAYMGVIALVFALHGALHGRGPLRNVSATLAPFLAIVALGRYSKLYSLLFYTVPGFAYVRAPSKFMFFATLFAGVLAAIGLHRLLAGPDDRRAREARRTASLALVILLVLAGLYVWVTLAPAAEGVSGSPLAFLYSLNDIHTLTSGDFIRWRAAFVRTLGWALALFATASLLLLIGSRRVAALWLLAIIGMGELYGFANANRGTSGVGSESHAPPALRETYARAGTDRVMEAGRATKTAMYERGFGIWGYDPVMSKRYAQLIAFTQQVELTEINNISGHQPGRYHPFFRMLRARYLVSRTGEVTERKGVWPRFVLVDDYEVASDDEGILDAMRMAAFAARKRVILEQEPEPAPRLGGAGGEVRLLAESTDTLDLEVELDEPAVLVVTDVHADGWRARALPGSDQAEYALLRGNFVLRAVPLGAGHHRLRIEYVPWPFEFGKWISIASCMIYLALVLRCWRLRARVRQGSSSTSC